MIPKKLVFMGLGVAVNHHSVAASSLLIGDRRRRLDITMWTDHRRHSVTESLISL